MAHFGYLRLSYFWKLHLQIYLSSQNSILPMDTLLGKTKPEVIENKRVWRVRERNNGFFWNVRIINNLNAGTQWVPFVENSCWKLELFIETSMEEIKPVDIAKPEFEDRVESILLALSRIFEPSGFRFKCQTKWFSCQIDVYLCNVFAWQLDGRIKSVITEIQELQFREVSLIMALFQRLRTIKNLMQRSKWTIFKAHRPLVVQWIRLRP